MSQNTLNSLEKNAAVNAAGRELIESALQRNPLAAVGASLLGPVVSMFRRRRSTPAAVRKMKLQSYSYSPVPSTRAAGQEPREGTSKASRTHLERTPLERGRDSDPSEKRRRRRERPRVSSTAHAVEGGLHHGQD